MQKSYDCLANMDYGKNVVIIGDADSIFIADYIAWVRSHSNNRFCLITWRNNRYKDIYSENKIKVILISDKAINNRFLRAWSGYKLCKRELEEWGPVDVLHFKFLDVKILIWSLFLIKQARYIVMTFWGGDLFNIGSVNKIILRRFLPRADKITIMTKEMEQEFHRCFGHGFDRVMCLHADYGIGLYDYIEASEGLLSKAECKSYWHLPLERIIVHIGYNAIEAQQHLKMIECLGTMHKAIIDKIHIVMHFGYGVQSAEYRERMESFMIDKGMHYTIIDKYIYKREMAIFRRSADIWLYGQTTDAFSSSMCEYLYAGVLMIKGEWLKYSELIDGDYYYLDFNNNFENLSDLLCKAIMGGYISGEKLKKNRENLKGKNSWDVCGQVWLRLYEELVLMECV